MKNIICLLAVRPCTKTYAFFKSIQMNTDYDVYIVIDDNTYTIPEYDGVVKVIKINNQECESHGFKSSVLWFNNKACSRDKALYYFTKKSIDYKYIWFVEEDTFIPSIYTIQNIDAKYSSDHYDLFSAKNIVIHEKQTDWHWSHINSQIKIQPPYAASMICAIRCSKELCERIKQYADTYKNLFMDEALFNTIALQNNLRVLCIPELSTIVYQRDWDITDIVDTNLYHPIKSIDTQYLYRKRA